MLYSQPLDFRKWVDEHRHLLCPPVGNAKIWSDSDLVAFVVGGPNARTDYHDDPYEEFFYQIEGDMVLRLMEEGRPRDVPIRAGEIFLLPPHVRHSPQRPVPGSIGLVIERQRPEGVVDGFEWFCSSCNAVLHRVEVQVRDVARDLPPAFERFYANSAARTCRRCGVVHPGKLAA